MSRPCMCCISLVMAPALYGTYSTETAACSVVLYLAEHYHNHYCRIAFRGTLKVHKKVYMPGLFLNGLDPTLVSFIDLSKKYLLRWKTRHLIPLGNKAYFPRRARWIKNSLQQHQFTRSYSFLLKEKVCTFQVVIPDLSVGQHIGSSEANPRETRKLSLFRELDFPFFVLHGKTQGSNFRLSGHISNPGNCRDHIQSWDQYFTGKALTSKKEGLLL